LSPPRPASWLRAITPALADDDARLSGRIPGQDGPDNQRLIGAVLRRAASTSRSGRTASSAAHSRSRSDAGEPFDVVLMDMQMPVLDGFGAVERLRARGYRGAIIALTANAMAGDRARSLAIGCDDHATKPISRESCCPDRGQLKRGL
jgi:CheY-like chemotaxis protein